MSAASSPRVLNAEAKRSPWYSLRGGDGSEPIPECLYPASGRSRRRNSYHTHPKYKKYTQQVEKRLSSFDNVHEWADFISFLKQLLKVSSGTSVEEISV